MVATPPRSGPDSFDTILKRSNLTRRQLLIYTGQKLHPGVLLYDAVWAIHLRGIDRVLFERAFQTLVNSCDALRTVLEERDGVPFQRVRPRLPYAIAHVDLRSCDQPLAAADAWIDRHCRSSFDLTRQLFDTALLRTADEESIWYLNVHHVIADGWAIDLLVQQMLELYRRLRRGELPDLVLLPSFEEHVSRERARRQLSEYDAAEAYWREKLAVPVEQPRFYGQTAPRQSTSKQRLVVELGTQWTAILKEFSRRDDVFIKSMDATMTNVFGALLFMYGYRVSGHERLSLGFAFHNRVSEEQKQLVGLLMEVLPFVVTVGSEESFLALVQRVHREASEALQHRKYSVGNPLQDPVYDMFLNSIRTIRLDEGQGPARRVFPGQGETSLSLSVLDAAVSDNLELWFDVRSDLLDVVGSEALVRHFRTILEAAITHPDQPISRLPLAAEPERRELLVDWNQTKVDDPGSQCIHHLFEEQVQRTPVAAAVVCGEQQVTYQELNRRANQLAHLLRKLGVGPETLVGICLERTLNMVVAVLGILKAGGAYVPLDPAYPQERLAFMVEDARLSLLLTQQHLQHHFCCDGLRVVCVDVEQPIAMDENVANPVSEVARDNLAYVIYTSGSTGRPKGVMICHRSVCNYLRWRRDYFPLTEVDALLQTSSLSFDDSVWEIFEPLLVGARLVLVDAGFEQDVPHLVQLIIRHQITAVCLVPSLLRAFLDEKDVDECRCLRRVTTGGETLSVELVERFFRHLAAALYNGYGPTEATIGATFWRCEPGSGRRTVPIGRPIANVQAYVLDHDLQPAPIGMAGELYLGGAGLARGYLNHPELTAERFVPHPFSREPGSRLYKTGDLARWLADGNLEFLGRVDRQVKLRGFRIELGEIEAALGAYPAVREAAVVLREDAPGDKRLVAYVTARNETTLSANKLQSLLRQKLPRHMIPSRIVLLDRLPLTPNGKVDRSSLPAPDLGRPELECAYVAPRTWVEEVLARIFAEVLGLERIGIHDSFFELGGHSLLAVRLFTRIEKEFGRRLALSTLFQGTTVHDLAELLESDRTRRSQERVVAIQPSGTRRPLFLVHSLEGELLFWRDMVRHLGPDQPCYGLQPAQIDGSPELFPQLTDMAGCYVNELRRVQPEGPYALAGHSIGGLLAFEMARHLVARGHQVSFLGLIDTWGEGYPSILPLRRRIIDHLKQFRTLPPDEKVKHVAKWAAAVIGKATSRFGQHAPPNRVRASNPSSGKAHDTSEIQRLEWPAFVPRTYEGCVVLFRAEQQPRSLGLCFDDPSLGWGRLASGGVEILDVPGGHHSLFDKANVKVLAEKLSTCLQRVELVPCPYVIA